MGFRNRIFGKGQEKDQPSRKSSSKKPLCPYCKNELAEKPTRKKKCPFCENYIYVRQGKLLTEDEKDIDDWLKRVEGLGVTYKLFKEQRSKLSQEFGQQASVNDTAWRILNSLVVSKQSNSNRKIIYLEMAHIVTLEGKNPNPYLTEAVKYELLDFSSSGIKKVKVTNANDSLICANCRKLENKVISINQALKEMPIPNNCEKKTGCRCWYSPIFDR